MSLPEPVVEGWSLPRGRQLLVVRDDLIPGGTKQRVVPFLFDGRDEYVYASPAEGYAQVAVAHACTAAGRKATVFVADRKAPHANTLHADIAGACVKKVRPGYFNVVKARAREYCAATGACLLPFGLDSPDVIEQLAALARDTGETPSQVWCVAGSGTLARALAIAWPTADLHAVQIGRELRDGDVPPGTTIHVAPERFAQNARRPPPFPSCANYDAKAWRFLKAKADDGALFWNVAA